MRSYTVQSECGLETKKTFQILPQEPLEESPSQYPNDRNMKVRSVSFWMTTETEDKTFCVEEYRLVDENLDYIQLGGVPF